MAREMAVAGAFYEKDFDGLNRQIESCFTHSLGPGDFPIKKRSGFVKALISPHAGYAYSGPCAAWGYKEIAESELADVYILIGPNHFALRSSISFEDWKTPFGTVKTDKDFARALSDAVKLPIDNSSHEKEHSLEVLLPFLQYANKDYTEKLRIVCITLSDDINIDKLALSFNEFLKCQNSESSEHAQEQQFLTKQNKKITFIISSDFTHYGRNYGYLPFSLDVEKRLSSLDCKAIDLIISKDANGFMSYVDRTGATICGALPIYLLLNLLKREKGSLLIYYRSSEISKDAKNSVSYASIMFK